VVRPAGAFAFHHAACQVRCARRGWGFGNRAVSSAVLVPPRDLWDNPMCPTTGRRTAAVRD